ncbi:MAG: glycosyltransferase family 39 protein, partial [Myxococcota bacterium]
MDWREPERPALVFIALLGACIAALAQLGTTPFWIDEAISTFPAREILTEGVPRSPFDVDFMRFQLKDGVWDLSAPLYRYALSAWIAVAGFSELSVRGFSVLWGGLMVVLAVTLALRIAGGKVAWLTALILLSTPDFIL